MIDTLELVAYAERLFQPLSICIYLDAWKDGSWVIRVLDKEDYSYLFSVLGYDNEMDTLHQKRDGTFSHYRKRANLESVKRGMRRVAEQQRERRMDEAVLEKLEEACNYLSSYD